MLEMSEMSLIMVNVPLVFSFDFQKAFDTVDHDIFLNKLYNPSTRMIALEMFKSYMSNRYQFKKKMIMNQKLEKYCVESHGCLYEAHFYSW